MRCIPEGLQIPGFFLQAAIIFIFSRLSRRYIWFVWFVWAHGLITASEGIPREGQISSVCTPAIVCETVFSEKYSVPNIKVFSAGYVWCSIPLPLAKVVLIVFWTVLAAVIEGMFLKWQ